MSLYNPYPIPKSSKAVARINNLLCLCSYPWLLNIGNTSATLKPIFSPLIPSNNAALSIKVGDDICFIPLQDDSCCMLHEAFDNIDKNQDINLPNELKQALLENLATHTLNELEQLLEVKIQVINSFIDIEQDHGTLSYKALHAKHHRLCFALNTQEELNSDETFFIDVWLPKTYNIQNIANGHTKCK